MSDIFAIRATTSSCGRGALYVVIPAPRVQFPTVHPPISQGLPVSGQRNLLAITLHSSTKRGLQRQLSELPRSFWNTPDANAFGPGHAFYLAAPRSHAQRLNDA